MSRSDRRSGDAGSPTLSAQRLTMRRDVAAIARYMAALAPVGRERKLDRRSTVRDLVRLEETATVLRNRRASSPQTRSESASDRTAAPAELERNLDLEDVFEGIRSDGDLGRLTDFQRLHRGDNVLRLAWLFLTGKSSDGQTIWLPLISTAIDIDRAPLSNRSSIRPIGDFAIPSGLFSDDVRDALEEEMESGPLRELIGYSWIGQVPVGGHSVAMRWARRVARELGHDDDAVADRSVASLAPKGTLRIVPTMAVYGLKSDDTPSLGATLRSWSEVEMAGTAVDALYNPGAVDSVEPVADLPSIMPLSRMQRSLVEAARSEPVTVISGPPGTGKTHTVAAIAIDQVLHGSSVLIAASSGHAIDAVVSHLESVPSPRHLRFGRRRDRATIADLLGGGLPPHDANLMRKTQSAVDVARDRVGAAVRALEAHVSAEAAFEDRLLSPAAAPGEQMRDETFRAAHILLDRIESAQEGVDDVDDLWGFFAIWRRNRTVRRLARVLRMEGSFGELRTVVRDEAARRAADGLLEAGGSSFVAVFDALEAAEGRLRSVTGDLVGLARRASRDARRTVASLATALRAGKTARRRMLRQLEPGDLVDVLPLWLGTLDEIDDVLPVAAQMFDVVIFDEASQINQVRALSALARARRCVVVGDPRQLRHVSFVADAQMDEAARDAGLDRTDPVIDVRRNSIFDVATSAAPVVELTEHYRSLPHLIEFSNHTFYGNRLRLMTRRPETERSDLIHVQLVDGQRDEAGVNQAEVLAVRDLIASTPCGMSVGVVSPFRAQADALEAMILDDLGSEIIARNHIRVGTVHGMQGSEADRMVISLAVDADAPSQALRFAEDPNLFNVMTTRARQEQWVVTSLDVADLRPGLITHYIEYSHAPPDPEFRTGEQAPWILELGAAIEGFGLRVLYNYRVAGWRIDLVVTDGDRSVAVECGVHERGVDAHIERHRALRRAGWRIVDAHQSAWLAAPDGAADRVAKALLAAR